MERGQFKCRMLPTLSLVLAVCMALASAPTALAGEPSIPKDGLIVDLDADRGITQDGGTVSAWRNQVDWKVKDFKATRDAGRPSLRPAIEAIGGHASLVFKKQELVNDDEDAFDHLITGSGYTWFAVLAVYQQVGLQKDVNAFFGNLRNGQNYEGFWGALNDDNSIWIGSRNSNTFGRWNIDNPKVQGPKLEASRFYVVAGRMGAGTGEVTIELFVNDPKPVASAPFPVNPKANSSKMAIGQERDARNHPGKESFNGEIARMLFWERPLTDGALDEVFDLLKRVYRVH